MKPKQDKPRPFNATSGKAARIAAATDGDDGKPKLRRIEGNAYTGGPMVPEGWYHPVVIDLGGIVVPSQHRPILRQHDHEQIVGHTDEVKADKDGIHVAGPLSGEKQHTDKVTVPADNGFQWQLSVGADPIRTSFLKEGEEAEVNGRKVTGPMTISHETRIGEISFVPLGADGDTSALVASRGKKLMFAKAALKLARTQGVKAAMKYSDEEIDKMSDDEAKVALKKCMAGDDDSDAKASDDDDDGKAKASGDDDDKDDDDADDKKDSKSSAKTKMKGASANDRIKAARKAEADEYKRVAGIKARCTKYPGAVVKVDGKDVDLIAHAIEAGWSADKAEDKAEVWQLRASRPGANVGNGPTVYVTNQPEMNEAVIEAAILDACRHQFKLADDDFYTETTPDGKGTIRRVPVRLQREAQGELKARYTDKVQQAAHTAFRGQIGLQQAIQLMFRGAGSHTTLELKSQNGVRSMLAEWEHLERPGAIRAEGASNMSIGNVLANVLNKFALQGYLFVEQAWREFCAIRPVNDFKPTKSINLLGDVMYKALGPTGELANASLGDQAFANQAQPFGRIATIPYTHIVNDDLGILTGVPMKIGQGAGLALNDNIWTLIKAMLTTVNGDDGQPFFRTTSSQTAAAKLAGTAYNANKVAGAGGALSATSLQTVKALFDNQTDPNGNPIGFDGRTPILLHGPTNWQTATALAQATMIIYGGASAALQPNVNVWQGKFRGVMSRYMENANYVNSTTAWLMLFDPVALAIIEVAFLNGVDTPAVLTAGPDYQFDRLGISIRGTMPFGSNQQNFRGGVYAVGQ